MPRLPRRHGAPLRRGRPRAVPQRRHHLRRADRGGQGRGPRALRARRRRPPAHERAGPRAAAGAARRCSRRRTSRASRSRPRCAALVGRCRERRGDGDGGARGWAGPTPPPGWRTCCSGEPALHARSGGDAVLRKIQHVHFVGIGGSGMSGIAEVLLNLGYTVSGSDLKRSPVTDRLVTLGARIAEGHAAENAQRRARGRHLDRGAARQPRGGRGAPPRRAGDPARRDAGRADAPQVRGGGRGQPRQDHHHLDGGARARPRRARPDGGGGRAARRPRLGGAARARATSWWRRPTSRTARS